MRKYGTMFFEKYAQITLEHIVSEGYSDLVNRDRPDLQSPDGKSRGIEVTRAMEGSKESSDSLIKQMSGIVPAEGDSEYFRAMKRSGYYYGNNLGEISEKEYHYWRLAQPLSRVLESKVSKLANGLYGEFDRIGLFVFCKDPLTKLQVEKACNLVSSLQKYNELRYNTMYLSEISNLHACNLDLSISSIGRIVTYRISMETRKELFLETVRNQLDDEKILR